uniref:CRIB domain-containing protein n=1 Tax=Panagrolaimus sp. PS1159 TaxID=55785 RepID=A0AC35FIZ1_9BILA
MKASFFIGRVKIDRSQISGPTQFRHIGHMGADDLTGSTAAGAVNHLLSSKGSYEYSCPVPTHLRSNDIPITPSSA